MREKKKKIKKIFLDLVLNIKLWYKFLSAEEVCFFIWLTKGYSWCFLHFWPYFLLFVWSLLLGT